MSGKNIAKNKNGRFLRRRTCPFCFYFVITTKQTKTKRYGQKYIFYRTAVPPGSRVGWAGSRSSTRPRRPCSPAWYSGASAGTPSWERKKGGVKVHTVIGANEGVPGDIRFTSAATHDSFMLKPANLDNGDVRLSQGRHDALPGEDRFVC